MSARRALVTGGSGHIGAAVCRSLAADYGCHVLVHGSGRNERAAILAEELRVDGHAAESVVFDVRDAAAAGEAVERILRQGAVQIIVSNAGIHDDAPLAGMDEAQWRDPIEVSLHGFFNVVRPLLMPMLRSRWGRIVAVSSVSALIGNRGQANYAAAKAGLHGAVKALALECGSRGVTVNAVAPGIVATPESEVAFPKERIKALVPLQRAAEPSEIADVIGFVCSEKAAYITGQIISVNGGMA